jgi:small-conductance mechanosensitive channel/CRP-like cAMP-binding protein
MNTNTVAGLNAESLIDGFTQACSRVSLHEAGPRILLAFAVYAVLLIVLRLGQGRPLIRRLSMPINLLGLAAVIRLFLGGSLSLLHAEVPRVFTAAIVFFAVYLAMRVAEIGVFEFLFIRQGRKPVPVVLRDIARFILTASFLAFIVKAFFPGINFNVLAVSSIIVGYVLGNATQDTLGNLAAGLALNSEDSFSIGDWIAVGTLTGKVTDITWRSTRLQTKNLEDIIVPNSTLSKEILINFSRPTPELRSKIQIGVSYATPPNLVRQTLLGAARDVPGIDTEPAPKVRLVEYGDFAILYDVLFFVHDYAKLEDIRAELMNLIWYRFSRAGISIPFPIRDVRARQITREDDLAEERDRLGRMARLFAGVDLFATLTEEERLTVAAGCQSRVFASGENVVLQGAAGHSLFVIESGRVGVFVDQPGRARVSVGELGPGHFFGERSLLTGEGRSATITALEDAVVVELDKATFQSVLQAKPAMAEHLGRVLAERDLARDKKAAGADHTGRGEAEVQKGRQFMVRILTFFGLATPGQPEAKS